MMHVLKMMNALKLMRAHNHTQIQDEAIKQANYYDILMYTEQK